MKKLLALSALAAMLLSAAAFAFSGVFSFAEEESGAVTYIKSVNDLKNLAGNLNAHAILQNDITISGANWEPIGNKNSPFSGTFDGNGYKITYNLKYSKGTQTGIEAGLFGCVSGSVKRLTVEGKMNVTLGSGNIGAVAACLTNGGSVFNCYSNVDITVKSSMSSAIGGVVGTVLKSSLYFDPDASIVRCINNGRIKANVTTNGVGDGSALSRGTTGALGGILGFVADTAKVFVNKCANNGAITVDGGQYNIGGIVGQTSTDSNTTMAVITECANKADITVNNIKGERAAGIIAYVKSGNIDYCYNIGNVLAYTDSGKRLASLGYGTHFGIFGYANLGSSNTLSVKYCYSASEKELEAEICTVRNPSYASFDNFYFEGRTEYETALNSNATAGKAGTTFKDAADLTAKITAKTSKYKASSNENSYPVLSWEEANVLPSDKEFGFYLSLKEKDDSFDLRFVIHAEASHKGATFEAVFALSNGGTKTARGALGQEIGIVDSVYADNVAYVPAQGYKIFSLALNGIEYGEWAKVDIKIYSRSNTYFNATVNYSDLFEEKTPSKLSIGNLPDFPEGNVSQVYNAGPGLENDSTSTVASDSQMVVISGVKSASFLEYISLLEKSGYERLFSNEIESNLYYSYSKDGKNYYIYYTASTKEARIILDNTSSVQIGETGGALGSEDVEIYQYAIDYTKGTGQTSGRDYWAIDCGMCYVIKLADNSVFMIDGGHERQTSVSALEALNDFLHEITGTPEGEKVKIAGWFFSHAHGDHVFLCHSFLEKYHELYNLEAAYMNFPSYKTLTGGYDGGTFLMRDTINKYYPDAKDIKLHTGEEFDLQGAHFEVLYTHEDAVNPVSGTSRISDFNDSSTVIRVTVNGKSTMFLGDVGSVAESAICNMFGGSVLKSDAVQLSHHCFNNLPNLYSRIGAKLLLCPNSVENANGNDAKRQAAINAAGSDYQGILYAGDATYKLTFNDQKIKYERIAPYWDGFFVNYPASLGTFGGESNEERPLDPSAVLGMKDVSSLVYDKSATGTMGSKADEASQTIFDGDTATKWCVTDSSVSHVTFKAKAPIKVAAYQIFTGNDTSKFNGRNPKCWTLYGSVDGQSWEVIDSVYNGNMKTGNFEENTYLVDSPAEYQYFTLVIHSTVDGGRTMQLSELRLFEN